MLRGALQNATPVALVLAGAAVALFGATADFFLPGIDRGFGWNQAFLIAAGLALAAGGSAIQVFSGQRTRSDTLRFWAIVLQVVFVAMALQLYKVENRAFNELIMPLVVFGFIVHHHLPTRLQHPFFFLLGLASIFGVFVVADPVGGLWLIGWALTIAGTCLAPLKIWIRVALLVIVTGIMAAARTGAIETEWAGLILPILSSMFIFRAAIFLYDSSNKKGPTNIWQRLSYFFLPPNVVFPFFPVVDFATYGRTHYNENANRIYQRGVNWMLRGLLHLLLYRIVYLYLVIPPEDVTGAASFLQFITTNFGLYLRISGLFHLIIGMLLLFGYNLPETHTRFYFSNSFMDFWRRINIYWKDFMQKMFFNPSFVRLKKFGMTETTAIALSMFVVFFATWALHAYQWFWLRGYFLLAPADMMFWGLLAILLVGQLLLESRKPDAGARPRRSYVGPRALLVVRTISTFLAICILWSLWTSPSPADWMTLWVAAGLLPALEASTSVTAWTQTIATLAAVAMIFLISMGVTFGLASAPAPRRAPLGQRNKKPPEHAWRTAAICGGVAGALLLLHVPALERMVGPDGREVLIDLRQAKLNAQDQAKRDRGYYEAMTDVNQFSSELWALFMTRPNGGSEEQDAPMMRQRDDLLKQEYEPNASAVFNGVTYDINRWGMRDDDVELAPSPGVHRIAIVGPSHVAGWGVEVEQRFDTLLENRMDADLAPGLGLSGFEVLNFGVEGYTVMQRIAQLDDRVWAFKPDTLIFTAQTMDMNHDFLEKHIDSGRWTGYTFLDRLLADIGIRVGMERSELKRLLATNRERINAAILPFIAERARAQNVQLVWVYVPMSYQRSRDSEVVQLRQIAEAAGLTVIDLSDVFEQVEVEKLQTGPTDFHPNDLGHSLIADALFDRLKRLADDDRISLGLDDARMRSVSAPAN